MPKPRPSKKHRPASLRAFVAILLILLGAGVVGAVLWAPLPRAQLLVTLILGIAGSTAALIGVARR